MKKFLFFLRFDRLAGLPILLDGLTDSYSVRRYVVFLVVGRCYIVSFVIGRYFRVLKKRSRHSR